MESRIVRCGNSKAVIVNSKFLKALGLKKGDPVIVKYDETKGVMTVRFPGARQLRLTPS